MRSKLASISIFFPAYNEAANIAESVAKAIEAAGKVADDYEVIVVNDGSRDNTIEVVSQITQANPKVRLLTHEKNQGYGGALMTGFANSQKEWVFFTDADLQFDLNELILLVECAEKSDVVLGYRIKRSDPFMRLMNAKGWSFLNRLLFGLKVKDIDCAFKLIRNDVLKNVLPQMISVRGAMISAELLIRLQQAGHKFIEVGVNHYPRKAGSATGAKPKVIVRAFREMLAVYRAMRKTGSS